MVKYSEEQKEAAITLAKEIGIMAASKELHISDQTIRAWRLRAEEKAHPLDSEMNNSEDQEVVDPLGEEEPPVENIETFYPEQDNKLVESQRHENQELSSLCEKKVDAQDPSIKVRSEQDQEVVRLRAENEELKVRIKLLKKSLYGIVEAIASL